MLPEAVQRRHGIERQRAAVDADLPDTLFPELCQRFAVEALPPEYHRRSNGHAAAAEAAPDLLEHRLGGLRHDGLTAAGAVLDTQLAVKKPQVVVDLREGGHGGPAPSLAHALLDGHRGRDARHVVDLGAVHDLQVLPDVVRQALEIAALPLCKEDVEGERRFPGTAHARDDDEFVPGDGDREILQVVLAGAPDLDVVPVRIAALPSTSYHRRDNPAGLREVGPQVGPGLRRWVSCDLFRGPCSHEVPSGLAALRSEIDDVVGALDHLGVVFDDDDAVPGADQVLEGREQDRDVAGVESHGGLVEDEQRIADLFQPEVAGELDPLGLAAGKRVDGLPESQVAEPHVDERLKGFLHFLLPIEEGHRLTRGHLEDVVDAFPAVPDLENFLLEAPSVALRAGQVDVREKLHLHLLEPLTLTGLAAAACRVEGEGRCRESFFRCCRLGCKERPDGVKGLEIGKRRCPRCFPDRALVHEDDVLHQAGPLDRFVPARTLLDTAELSLQGPVEDVHAECALA